MFELTLFQVLSIMTMNIQGIVLNRSKKIQLKPIQFKKKKKVVEGFPKKNFRCAQNAKPHTEKSFRNLIKSNQNQIVGIYHFPIDLKPNGPPYGSKSIGKW